MLNLKAIIFAKFGTLWYNDFILMKKKVQIMAIIIFIYILIVLIVALVLFAIAQIKLAGIKVKDFWSFIEANQILDKLYRFARKYERLTAQEQLVFLSEAEKVFDAFDKVPNMLWEDEYQKYMDVLDKYKNIKVARWTQN